MAPTTIELDLNKKYQTIDGFGYAITYSSCYNLMQMNPEARLALLKRIYSTTEGYGVSYARISLGCNDFSSTEYTYCDTKGSESDPISNFALYSDENDYVIPVLKEILAINPNLKIIAAPWTCPKWMKVTGGSIVSRAWCEWMRARGRDPKRPKNRTTVPTAVKDAVLRRDGLICQICGGDIPAEDLHIDHDGPRHPD